jgi:hypothetical protein
MHRHCHGFLVPVLLLLFSAANGQNYIHYHNLRNQAEEAIIHDDFATAVYFYNEMYSGYDFMFASDCYRAIQASVLAGDTVSAFRFVRKSFLQGVTKEVLDVSPIIGDLKMYPLWKKVLAEYDSLHAVYLGRINTELRKRIIPVYEDEQYYNELHDNAVTWKFLPTLLKYKQVNKIYADSLVKMIREIGHFPGEREIGLIDTGMYVFDSLSQQYYNPVKSRPYLTTHEYLILVHYYQLLGIRNYDSLLYPSVESGYLEPGAFAFFSDNRFSKKRKDHYLIFGRMYAPFYDEDLSEKKEKYYRDLLNENRRKIGLRSLELDEQVRSRIGWLRRQQWSKKNYRFIYIE